MTSATLTSEQIKAGNARQRKYDALPETKAARRRWAASPEGQAIQRKYRVSSKGKVWIKGRRAEYKARAQEYLGGACASCGATDDLEFDHIIASSKSFNISRCYTLAWETLVKELDLCQLLCSPCHVTKSREDRNSVIG